jgi:hypothetical protein
MLWYVHWVTLLMLGSDCLSRGKTALKFFGACLLLSVFGTANSAAQDAESLRRLSQSPSSPLPDLIYFKGDEEPESVPVRQRPRPDYNALGIRLGSFIFHPTFEARTFYDTNALAASGNPKSDSGIIFSSQLAAISDFNNHELVFEAGISRFEHFNLTSESRTEGRATFSGRLDVRRDIAILAAGSFARRHETRGTSNSPVTAAEPVPYDDFDASLSITKKFNRIEVSAGMAVERRNYHDVRLVGGGSLDQDFRDGNLLISGTRIAYTVQPGFRVFGDARYNWRRYDNLSGLNSDSQGYNLLAGFEFTLSSLMRGDIGIGYLEQSYDTAKDATGLSYSANLIWTPTPLITANFEGRRTVSETGIGGAIGRIDTTFGVVVDYEFRRNLIISPSIDFLHEDYAGISRSDWVVEPKLRIDRLINRYFSVGAEYAYTHRSSNIGANDFDRHIVSVNAQAKF